MRFNRTRPQRILACLLWIPVASIMFSSLTSWAMEAPGDAREPGGFFLTEEQVMGPRFLDHVREAVEDWARKRYDQKTGGFGSLLHTTDMIWSRYAVNAKDLGAPDRERMIAYLDAQVPAQTGHLLWMSVRAMRILGGEPSSLPRVYADKRTAESFGAFARDHIGSNRHHHVILGMLPLVVSSGDPQYVDALVDAIRSAPREKPELWPGDYSRRFAYSAVLLSEFVQQNQARLEGLQKEDIRLFALWLDLLCVDYSYSAKNSVKDAAGYAWPLHPDLDVNNPLGLEVVPPAAEKTAHATPATK